MPYSCKITHIRIKDAESVLSGLRLIINILMRFICFYPLFTENYYLTAMIPEAGVQSQVELY